MKREAGTSLPATHHRASGEARRCHSAVSVPKLQQFLLWRTTVGGYRPNTSTAVGGWQSVEKYGWRAPNRLLVVQTGVSASMAKVFKAHAVPQGLCENLINALKLLANQRIVTGLCGSRKAIVEGLRNFFEIDNHCALDINNLKFRYKVFRGTKAKVRRGVRRQSGKVPRN